MTSSSTLDEGVRMLGLLKTQAAQGNQEAIQTVAILRNIGLIDVEPNVEEIPIWQILDMCVTGSKQRKRDYWLQKHQ